MAGQQNAKPAIIIKRVKSGTDGAQHHGGAWKVAYADFVTAMMAFFMLMWLLNATTEKQKHGLADYFNPTVATEITSGGGENMFAGDSLTDADAMTFNGSGATDSAPAQHVTRSDDIQPANLPDPANVALLAELQRKLLAISGESEEMVQLMRHVITKISDEGVVIELYDLPEAQLFADEGDVPTDGLRQMIPMILQLIQDEPNQIAISSHARSYPVILRRNPVWNITLQRAQAIQQLISEAGLSEIRFDRMTGNGDRKTIDTDKTSIRNNRIEVILLTAPAP